MPLSAAERTHLRDLALRVREIAAHPHNAERREMWYRHNDLKPVRPMVLIFPEGSWVECMPDSEMTVADPFWRQREWWLRHVIYRWENLRDDNVIEPNIELPPSHRGTTGWGLSGGMSARPGDGRGAAHYAPAIFDPADIGKLLQPHLVVDQAKKREAWDSMQDVFGDILEVRWKRSPGVNTWLADHACYLRGLDQVMYDMIERPEWLHELFTFLRDANTVLLDELEASGELELMEKAPDYPGSGGTCYTHDLPAPDHAGKARLKDTWGFAQAQEFTLISPRMFEEFAIHYQAPLVERFGLNCFGCCEDITAKLDVIMNGIPHLRRISISPWTDVCVAAEKLGNRYIYSWKPNPAIVANPYDPDRIREYTRRTLDVACGCVVEMILKDTHTCNHHPERLAAWVRIAQEEAERAASLS